MSIYNIDSPEYEELAKLSWKILEAKYWYYRRSEPRLSDYDYDMLEKEYERLCEKLNIVPTASNMVDFDESRPSCKHVILKFEGEKAFRKEKTKKRKLGPK